MLRPGYLFSRGTGDEEDGCEEEFFEGFLAVLFFEAGAVFDVDSAVMISRGLMGLTNL